MGRYAQRRRAATTASPWTPPVVANIIDAVQNGIWVVRFTFDVPVTWTGDLSDSQLTVGFFGAVPDSGNQIATNIIDIHFTAAAGSGDTWNLTGNPSWLVQDVTNPASGLVT